MQVGVSKHSYLFFTATRLTDVENIGNTVYQGALELVSSFQPTMTCFQEVSHGMEAGEGISSVVGKISEIVSGCKKYMDSTDGDKV